MNRVGEYIRFAVWFSGLGYIVLWPMTAHDDGIAVASFACGQSFVLADFICGPRAGLHLSPGLHLAGMMSSAFVVMCLVLRPLRRRRARAAGKDVQTAPVMIHLRIGKKSVPPPHRYVRPRSHFGLRNAPH
jgi:hypothetical protein